MTVNQAAQAMKALAGEITVKLSDMGSWYVSLPGVHIYDRSGYGSFPIFRETIEDAVWDTWIFMTNLKHNEVIGVRKEDKTYFYRWNGFMWQSCERPK